MATLTFDLVISKSIWVIF